MALSSAAKPPYSLTNSRDAGGSRSRAKEKMRLSSPRSRSHCRCCCCPPPLRRPEPLATRKSGFSAERVLVFDGHSYVGRMWNMPGEQRHEQELPSIKPVFILRAGSSIGDVLLPQLHTAVEFDLPKVLAVLGQPDLLGKPVGQETVNGIATTKYEVDKEIPDGHLSGALWLSATASRCAATAATRTARAKLRPFTGNCATSKSASKMRACSRCRPTIRNCRRKPPRPCSGCASRRIRSIDPRPAPPAGSRMPIANRNRIAAGPLEAIARRVR